MTENEIISQASDKQLNVACDATDATKFVLDDASVIKALECCGSEKGNLCTLCPRFKKLGDNCNENDLFKDALDLINRQKAEIERLQKVFDLPSEGFFNLLCGALVYTKTLEEYNNFRRTIKTEAIKEFAERLKKIASEIIIGGKYKYRVVTTEGIDNLVKETENDNG